MASSCGRYTLVFNGEIYNHFSMREALGSEAWRGHSDTETLVEAIAAWGLERALQQANGMFALALWDEQNGVLKLARDRIGEKPLYWGTKSGCFVFASELGPILTSGLGPFKLDHDAVADLLNLGYIPDPRSVVREMRKLRPATIMTVNRKGEGFETHESTYWTLEGCVGRALSARTIRSEAEWMERIESDFTRAVKLRLIADVPLGAFLSGGIDSGLVVSMMAKHSPVAVRTFTIGIPTVRNESERASELAGHLGTKHTTVDVTENECIELIPKLPNIYSEPFGDSSQIPTWLVSRLAREKVTVALSGDGGDELFAGYHRHFLARRIWNVSRRIPQPIGRVIASERLGRLLSRVVTRDDGRALRIQKGIRMMGARTVESMYEGLVRHWPPGDSPLVGLTTGQRVLPGWISSHEGLDSVERLMLYDLASALPGDMLVKVDRASMAHSLETRVPFLDHEFIETALQVPVDLKISGGRGKVLLRKLMAKHAPSGWMDAPQAQMKIGFGIPIERWLRGELREWAEDLLDDRKLNEHGLFDTTMIRESWIGMQDGTHANHHAMWSMLMFQAWYGTYKAHIRID